VHRLDITVETFDRCLQQFARFSASPVDCIRCRLGFGLVHQEQGRKRRPDAMSGNPANVKLRFFGSGYNRNRVKSSGGLESLSILHVLVDFWFRFKDSPRISAEVRLTPISSAVSSRVRSQLGAFALFGLPFGAVANSWATQG